MNDNVKLAVFSGKCLQAVCGIDTGFKDMRGAALFTGDIVQTYTVREYDTKYGPMLDYAPDELTAVVSDEWTTYSDGKHVRKAGDAEYFVMGIRSVSLEDTGEWRVRKLKSYEDVIVGEHWAAYGFNYLEAPEATYAVTP